MTFREEIRLHFSTVNWEVRRLILMAKQRPAVTVGLTLFLLHFPALYWSMELSALLMLAAAGLILPVMLPKMWREMR